MCVCVSEFLSICVWRLTLICHGACIEVNGQPQIWVLNFCSVLSETGSLFLVGSAAFMGYLACKHLVISLCLSTIST